MKPRENRKNQPIMEETRATLLRDMKQLGSEAWEIFFHQYARCIMRFARKQGLSPQDAQDVLQETMVALMRNMKDFTYDPARSRFRTYLLQIVRNRCLVAMKRSVRHPEICLPNEELPETPVCKLPWQDMDDCWEETIREEAFQRVLKNPDFEGKSIDIFDAYVTKGMPPSVVAKEFGVSENVVYQTKNRLMQCLRRELIELSEGELGGSRE